MTKCWTNGSYGNHLREQPIRCLCTLQRSCHEKRNRDWRPGQWPPSINGLPFESFSLISFSQASSHAKILTRLWCIIFSQMGLLGIAHIYIVPVSFLSNAKLFVNPLDEILKFEFIRIFFLFDRPSLGRCRHSWQPSAKTPPNKTGKACRAVI